MFFCFFFSKYVLLQRDKTDAILSAYVAGGQSEPASTSKVQPVGAGTGAEQLSWVINPWHIFASDNGRSNWRKTLLSKIGLGKWGPINAPRHWDPSNVVIWNHFWRFLSPWSLQIWPPLKHLWLWGYLEAFPEQWTYVLATNIFWQLPCCCCRLFWTSLFDCFSKRFCHRMLLFLLRGCLVMLYYVLCPWHSLDSLLRNKNAVGLTVVFPMLTFLF